MFGKKFTRGSLLAVVGIMQLLLATTSTVLANQDAKTFNETVAEPSNKTSAGDAEASKSGGFGIYVVIAVIFTVVAGCCCVGIQKFGTGPTGDNRPKPLGGFNRNDDF